MNPDKVSEQSPKGLICLALAVVVFAAYILVVRNGFINFDDPEYVTQNPFVQQGLSWGDIKWAFTGFHASNWHPVTWLSHMLDCQLFGSDPAGHHLASLAFHLANTLLLFLLIEKLTARLWPSAFVALLFGIHPMHVESVAWVSERKDVLSAFFFMLTLLYYARYARSRVEGRGSSASTAVQALGSRLWTPWRAEAGRRRLDYGLALFFFALGLLSKPMLVTLPFVLLLLDYWPLGRVSSVECRVSRGGGSTTPSSMALARRRINSLLYEKLPFFALSTFSCAMTLIAQFQFCIRPVAEIPMETRLAHTPVAYVWYVLKLFWPDNLSVFYPLYLPRPFELFGALVLLAILTWLVWRWRRNQPYLLVGWLWFLGMLVPVIGLVQVGEQAYADRYTYLPYIGLFIMLAWGVPALLTPWRHARTVLYAGALLAAVACFCLSVAQVRVWKDTRTLFVRALALDNNNYVAWCAMGVENVFTGDKDQAVNCFRQAATISPKYFMAWNNLGCTLFDKGEYDAALSAFQMAMQCTQNYAPSRVAVYFNFGRLFLATGRFAEAITNFQKAIEFIPDQPEIYKDLGCAFVRNHQSDQAIAQFQRAFALQPADASTEFARAAALTDSQRPADAINQLYQVLALDSNSVPTLNNLAWQLATTPDPALRDGNEAVRLAERGCQLTEYKVPVLIGTLAAAYAEAGRYNDAVTAAGKARAAALAQGQNDVAAKNEQLLELYKSGQPFHQETNSSP